ncbi:ATP-binding protein [Candidatus Woesearchaeota archaeon]|nr:ATP-binding protein [Candidatus Woesearchaeota archaeon]
MVYKISLSSTQGTGKTTLATLVAGELKRRNVEARALAEMSTLARERGLPINEQTTREAQLWILHSQFAEELAYQTRTTPPLYDVIICDRGVDNYCYLQRRFGEDEYALRMTLGHLQHFPYDQIYVLPIVDDALKSGEGIRSTDPEFQREMDTAIRGFFQDHNIPYRALPQPAAEDQFRTEWVKIIVNQTLTDLERGGLMS